MNEPGWYQAPMDPVGTQRWFDGYNWTTQVQAAPAEPAPRPLAAIPLRALARAIDFVLAMLLASAAHRLWTPRVLDDDAVSNDGLLRVDEIFPTEFTPTVLLATVVVFVLWELYWLLSEGATPGKQLVGLYVSDPNSLRGTVEFVPAVKRNLHRAIAIVPFGWVAVAISSVVSLVLMFDDRSHRRSLMDRFAGTTVHRLPPGSPRFTPWLRVWGTLFVALRLAAWLLN